MVCTVLTHCASYSSLPYKRQHSKVFVCVYIYIYIYIYIYVYIRRLLLIPVAIWQLYEEFPVCNPEHFQLCWAARDETPGHIISRCACCSFSWKFMCYNASTYLLFQVSPTSSKIRVYGRVLGSVLVTVTDPPLFLPSSSPLFEARLLSPFHLSYFLCSI